MKLYRDIELVLDLTNTDSVYKSSVVNQSENVTVSDSLYNAFSKYMTETIATYDSNVFAIGKWLIEEYNGKRLSGQ